MVKSLVLSLLLVWSATAFGMTTEQKDAFNMCVVQLQMHGAFDDSDYVPIIRQNSDFDTFTYLVKLSDLDSNGAVKVFSETGSADVNGRSCGASSGSNSGPSELAKVVEHFKKQFTEDADRSFKSKFSGPNVPPIQRTNHAIRQILTEYCKESGNGALVAASDQWLAELGVGATPGTGKSGTEGNGG